MQQFTNNKGIPIELAVLLATDKYDHNPDPMTISATTLMKPIKEIVLAMRKTKSGVPTIEDISTRVNSVIGTAIHTALEDAWRTNYRVALKSLGYSDKIINAIHIDPTDQEVEEATGMFIPIYLEKRVHKKVGDWTVSGQFDLITEGKVKDLKTTSTYTYESGCNDDKYILQASIYRWLNPEIIVEDSMSILFMFLNWSGIYKNSPTYPKEKVIEKAYNLLTFAETDKYIRDKLAAIDKYLEVDESSIPECTPEQLWQDSTVWKYYKNPEKTSRATKNFNDKDYKDPKQAAQQRLSDDGFVGIVKEVHGKAKACNYCSVKCLQYIKMREEGLVQEM